MGYYVSGHGDVIIEKANLEAAHAAMVALQDAPDEAKRGGSYQGGKCVARWFSWMPSDLRTIPTARAMFEELGFDVQEQENGDLLVMAYDNKTGQEDVFFAAAAPFIKSGSEFYWEGEDGMKYKWSFHDGKMYQHEGHVEYDERGAHVSVASYWESVL